MLATSGLQTNFAKPVSEFLRTDFATVRSDWTIQRTLDEVRATGLGDRIVYFYVVDETEKLVGVLPTRRLLTEPLDQLIKQIMIPRVVAVRETTTLLEACEFFVLYKFYALPVVDAQRRIVGVVDVGLFTEEVLNVEEKQDGDEIFQTIGFHVEELRHATPLKAFRYRIPWLLATITSGSLCAFLTGAFAQTLSEQLVLAFFMTLVLGLGESVSAQSMAMTLQALHTTPPSLRWIWNALRKELPTAAILGACCGAVVFLIVCIWRGQPGPGAAIGSSIFAAMVSACLLGVLVPTTLRLLKLDPKIASGPLTLAFADICTLAWYFGIATLTL